MATNTEVKKYIDGLIEGLGCSEEDITPERMVEILTKIKDMIPQQASTPLPINPAPDLPTLPINPAPFPNPSMPGWPPSDPWFPNTPYDPNRIICSSSSDIRGEL